MVSTASAMIPLAVARLRQRVEQWRRARPHRRAMPDDLWMAASVVAREYGVHSVARAVRLDYYSLKRRVEENTTSVADGPSFVEVAVSPTMATAVGESVVEMERPDGARMLVRVSGTDAVVRLSEAFWRGMA